MVRNPQFLNLPGWTLSSSSKATRKGSVHCQSCGLRRYVPLFFLVVGAFAFQRFGFWEKQGRHNILLQLVSCVFSEFGISNLHLFYNCACNHHHTPHPRPPPPFQTQLVRQGVHQASLVIETSDKAVEAECREAHQSPLLPLRWLSQSRCVVSVLGSLLKYLDPTGGDLHERLAQR